MQPVAFVLVLSCVVAEAFLPSPGFLHNQASLPISLTKSNQSLPRRLLSTNIIMSSTTTTSSTPEPLTIGVSHVGISVSDLKASLQFFEALGYKKVGGSESYPSIFVTDGSSLITLWQTDQDFTAFNRRKNVGLHHLAIKVPSLDALDRAYQAASQVPGVRVNGEGAFGPESLSATMTHAILYEPSGNRIELAHHAA